MSTTTSREPLEPREAEVFAVLQDLYEAYLDGDRPRLEAHLDEGCTMWDSTLPALRTKADLQAGTTTPSDAGGRAPGSPAASEVAGYPSPVRLEATEPVVGLLGDDAAWEAHLLLAGFDDPALDEQLRCTSVLRRRPEDGRWVVVHHHEELIVGPGRGLAVRSVG
ncbi:YybH family protein [Terracoccus luteus]|jgi:hypothetical protein|uniref:Calcium/calmodulin-dependent protein kinase II association-domain domain-containing protein n=1 Tax=Terracoccus luteus TaxID=53356 RepID=A0A839PTV3_9MICO|nr:nuclear transport factor 2 family protein [Terracoccus luteus]MBB2986184.1 hypothetical protein [Terracoccus luteus]MCP2172226.1 hypothetical protein [Terracoccus luteus]